LEQLHRKQPVLTQGVPLGKGRGAVILLHGRGGTAEDILSLTHELQFSDLSYLAPQAAGQTWYPNAFLAPIASNEPWLSSALELVGSIVEKVAHAGVPTFEIVILGFSQGACLATEFVARNPARYGGLVAFTGGLIGPMGGLPEHSGNLDGTPCFLGAGDPDPHVPWQRVSESAATLRAMRAEVILKRYPGAGHTINQDEVEEAKRILEAIRRAP